MSQLPPLPSFSHAAADPPRRMRATAPPLCDDPLAVGAALLPDRALLALLLGPGAGEDDENEAADPEALARAAAALSLPAGPRLAALHELREGPRLLAALELGRRALLWPPAAGVRLRAPADAASLMLTRCGPGCRSLWALFLDEHRRVLQIADAGPSGALHFAALCERIFRDALRVDARALVLVQRGDALPRSRLPALRRALRRWEGVALALGIRLLDCVLLAEAGHQSLGHRGVLRAGRARWCSAGDGRERCPSEHLPGAASGV